MCFFKISVFLYFNGIACNGIASLNWLYICNFLFPFYDFYLLLFFFFTSIPRITLKVELILKIIGSYMSLKLIRINFLDFKNFNFNDIPHFPPDKLILIK